MDTSVVLTSSSVCTTYFECSAGVGVGGEGEMKVIGVGVSLGVETERLMDGPIS